MVTAITRPLRPRRPRRVGGVAAIVVVVLVVIVAASWAVVRQLTGPDLGFALTVRRAVEAKPGEAAVPSSLHAAGRVSFTGSLSADQLNQRRSGLVAVAPTEDYHGVTVRSLLDPDGGWTLGREDTPDKRATEYPGQDRSVLVIGAGASSDFGVVAVLWDDGWLAVRRMSDGAPLWQQRVGAPDVAPSYNWVSHSDGLRVVDADSVVVIEGAFDATRWVVVHRDRAAVVVDPGAGCQPVGDIPITSYAAYLVAACRQRRGERGHRVRRRLGHGPVAGQYAPTAAYRPPRTATSSSTAIRSGRSSTATAPGDDWSNQSGPASIRC